MKGRRKHRRRGAKEEGGNRKWEVGVAEMEAAVKAREVVDSRQPAEEATEEEVGMDFHKLSTLNNRPDLWRRRWLTREGKFWRVKGRGRK